MEGFPAEWWARRLLRGAAGPGAGRAGGKGEPGRLGGSRPSSGDRGCVEDLALPQGLGCPAGAAEPWADEEVTSGPLSCRAGKARGGEEAQGGEQSGHQVATEKLWVPDIPRAELWPCRPWQNPREKVREGPQCAWPRQGTQVSLRYLYMGAPGWRAAGGGPASAQGAWGWGATSSTQAGLRAGQALGAGQAEPSPASVAWLCDHPASVPLPGSWDRTPVSEQPGAVSELLCSGRPWAPPPPVEADWEQEQKCPQLVPSNNGPATPLRALEGPATLWADSGRGPGAVGYRQGAGPCGAAGLSGDCLGTAALCRDRCLSGSWVTLW